MRKILLFASALLMLVPLACDNDEHQTVNENPPDIIPPDIIVDLAPITAHIYVNDAEGNNLLDPSSDRCYDISQIVLRYDDEEYSVRNPYTSNDAPEAMPLAYLAQFEQPALSRDKSGVIHLLVGEWGADNKWDMCSFEITWSDGSTDTFAFSSDYTYDPKYRNDSEHDFGYTFTLEAYLNGEKLGEDEYSGSVAIKYRLLK